MATRKNFKENKQRRREEAALRQARYDALPAEAKVGTKVRPRKQKPVAA